MGKANPKAIRLAETDFRLAKERARITLLDIAMAERESFEKSYCEKVSREHRRRYGQFFTPAHAARLMADWLASARLKTVLDPAVGPGILLHSVAKCAPNARLVGYDLDPLCIEYSEARLQKQPHTLAVADFLTSDIAQCFDGVIANPPYLRHHDLAYDFDIFADYSRRYGVTLSRLSNAYVLFLVKGLSLLKPGARAAFIIPAEWSNSNFGSALKKLFASRRTLRHVIYFNHDGLVFDDNLSTGCILLLENKPSNDAVHTHYVPADFDANSFRELEHDPRNFRSKFSAEKLAACRKWDYVISHGSQDKFPGLVSLKNLATTRRGIATGANSYFHVGADIIAEYQIPEEHLKPCVGKTRAVQSFLFSRSDWKKLRDEGQRAFLLDLAPPLTLDERIYIELGKEKGINRRYLTKMRKPWYSMEKQRVAPIWAAVFGRERMRFVVNDAGAHTLTAFHCVYPNVKNAAYIKALTACLNSKFIQDRARAKSRVYGGGLLKFEPKDLLEIEVPDLRLVSDDGITKLKNAFDTAEESTKSDEEQFNWEVLDALVISTAEEAASRHLL